jgi:hypothetical protein
MHLIYKFGYSAYNREMEYLGAQTGEDIFLKPFPCVTKSKYIPTN